MPLHFQAYTPVVTISLADLDEWCNLELHCLGRTLSTAVCNTVNNASEERNEDVSLLISNAVVKCDFVHALEMQGQFLYKDESEKTQVDQVYHSGICHLAWVDETQEAMMSQSFCNISKICFR